MLLLLAVVLLVQSPVPPPAGTPAQPSPSPREYWEHVSVEGPIASDPLCPVSILFGGDILTGPAEARRKRRLSTEERDQLETLLARLPRSSRSFTFGVVRIPSPDSGQSNVALRVDDGIEKRVYAIGDVDPVEWSEVKLTAVADVVDFVGRLGGCPAKLPVRPASGAKRPE